MGTHNHTYNQRVLKKPFAASLAFQSISIYGILQISAIRHTNGSLNWVIYRN